MSVSKNERLWEILNSARIMERSEREQVIMRELELLQADDILEAALSASFGEPELENVNDDDFNAAAHLAWSLIHRLRAETARRTLN